MIAVVLVASVKLERSVVQTRTVRVETVATMSAKRQARVLGRVLHRVPVQDQDQRTVVPALDQGQDQGQGQDQRTVAPDQALDLDLDQDQDQDQNFADDSLAYVSHVNNNKMHSFISHAPP